jgi:hypothetical protein
MLARRRLAIGKRSAVALTAGCGHPKLMYRMGQVPDSMLPKIEHLKRAPAQRGEDW